MSSTLFGLIILVIDISAILDVIKRKMKIEMKVVWILVILLLPILGPILYFLIGRKR